MTSEQPGASSVTGPTASEISSESARPALPAAPVSEGGPSIQIQQERMRGYIAIILVGSFSVLLFMPLLFITNWAETKEWFQLVLPSIAALLGSAMGFCFGSRNNG